ncbi:MAG: CPBP family intramembrane metalloprotease [Deltaproteobacteria bacterium]|uniref:CPBP family intramembrane metalloprotease n=1 Tax=Candidatus Zymogenus saltonus TaxID=2844893 RepID=A0A9D8KCH5_9DELT|nr:CPBP family intramembrane metalloprotease [Candidatus Zymogenus saltonus]
MEKSEKKFVPAALYLTAAVVGLLFPTHMVEGWIFLSIPAVFLALITLFFYRRHISLFGPTLFFLVAYITRTLPFYTLGLMFAFPIALYLITIRFFKSLWRDESPPSFGEVGEINKTSIVYGLVVIAVSSSALILWYWLFDPDIEVFTQYFPDVELLKLLVGGVVFAFVNSIVEEVVYRGILWNGLEEIFGSVHAVIAVQAVIFGVIHYWGIPNGILGAVMATVYGLFMGIIRNRAGGLLMPILVHTFADMTIFLILLNIVGRI